MSIYEQITGEKDNSKKKKKKQTIYEQIINSEPIAPSTPSTQQTNLVGDIAPVKQQNSITQAMSTIENMLGIDRIKDTWSNGYQFGDVSKTILNVQDMFNPANQAATRINNTITSSGGNFLKNTKTKEDLKNIWNDGYQFGDITASKQSITKSILGSSADLVANAAKGELQTAEGLVDTSRYLLSDAIDLAGGDKTASEIRQRAKQNTTGLIFGENDQYNNPKENGWLSKVDEYSIFDNTIDQISQSVGQQAFRIGLGKATGIDQTSTAGQIFNNTEIFAGSYGSAKSQALMEGADYGTASLRGTISGFAELISENMFDAIPGFKTAGFAEKAGIKDIIAEGAEKAFGKNAGRYVIRGLNSLGEGVEEGASNFLETAFTDIVNAVVPEIASLFGKEYEYNYGMQEGQGLDKNKSLGNNIKKLFSDAFGSTFTKETGQAFIVAAISTLITGAATDTMTKSQRNKVINEYAKENNISKEKATKLFDGIRDLRLKQRVESTTGYEQRMELGDQATKQLIEEYNQSKKSNQKLDLQELFDRTPKTRKESKFVFTDDEVKNFDRRLATEIATSNINNEQDVHDMVRKINVAQKINKTVQYHPVTTEGLYQLGFIDKDSKGNYTLNGKKYIPRGLTQFGNEIYVNLDVGTKSATQAMFHEMFESFKATSPDQYNKFKQMVVDIVGQETIDNEKAQYKQMYLKKGAKLTDNIEDEIINDKFGELAENQDFINRIANNRSVLERLIDSVKSMIKYVKGTPEEKEFIKLQNKLEKEFAKRYKETDFSKGEGDTAYSIVSNQDGTKTANFSEERLDNIISGSATEWEQNYARSYITRISPQDFLNLTTDTSMSSEEFLKKMDATDKYITDLDTERLKNERQNIYLRVDMGTGQVLGHEGRHRALALLKDGVSMMDIEIEPNGDAYDRYNATPEYPILNLKGQERINNTKDAVVYDVLAVSQNNIDRIKSEYLSNKNENQIRYSLTSTKDSQGRELSPQQQEYFKESKVVDENGNLLEVYHGTSSTFNVFDKSKIGANTNNEGLYGKGFYFTNLESLAEGYSKYHEGDNHVKKGYLNITNPFVWKNIKTEEQMNQFIEDNNIPEGTIKWNPYQQEIHTITEVENERAFSKALQDAGYDGIIYEYRQQDENHKAVQEIVAFESNQFKNVDNTNPTSNEDIRYSLTTNKDSNGRELSKEQQNYFKNTTMVDNNGNLEVTYHTTPNKFTIFKKSKIGENTGYDNTPFGFFITTNKNFSERFGEINKAFTDTYQYQKDVYDFHNKYSKEDIKRIKNDFDKFKKFDNGALYDYIHKNHMFWVQFLQDIEYAKKPSTNNNNYNVMEMYANIQKPITHPYNAGYKYEGTELDNIVENYFKAIGEEEGLNELKSYVEEGDYDTLYDAYMNIVATDLDSPFEYAAEERKKLENKGYDAVEFVEGLDKDVNYGVSDSNDPVSSYAVFNSNQIKNVDNTNPTSNEDIRYSLVDNNIVYRAGTQTGQMESGTFFAPNKTDADNYGNSAEYHIDKSANLYNGISSKEYAEQNNLMNVKNDVLKDKLGVDTLQEVEDIHYNWTTPSYLDKNPNLYHFAYQYMAKNDLENKGYDGAIWTHEDDLTPQQYQIWNNDKVNIDTRYSLAPTLSEKDINTTNNTNDAFFKEHETDFDKNNGKSHILYDNYGNRIRQTTNVYKLEKGDNLAKLSTTLEQNVEDNYGNLYIEELYVKNKSQGLGTEIVNSLKQYAKENNLKLHTMKELGNPRTQKFWNSVTEQDFGLDRSARELYSPYGSNYNISRVDSNGKKLSYEQREYFKDSKVVDENRNLLEVYRGEPTIGKTTYESRKGGGNKEINEYGIYFTNSKDFAKDFAFERISDPNDIFFVKKGKEGEVKSAYLNITNPLDLGTITEEEIRNLYPYESSMAKQLFDEDKFVSDMLHFQEIGNHQLMKSYLDMKAIADNTDYDGLIAKLNVQGNEIEYAVFNSNQIKNVDNTNPTSNEDIRYSLNTDAIRDLAKKIDYSPSMLEANLGDTEYEAKRYLTKYTNLVKQYMADNNIEVEPVMKSTELEKYSDAEKNFVKNNDIDVMKLANDSKLLDEFLEISRQDLSKAGFFKEEVIDNIIQQERDLFEFAKRNQEVPLSLKKYDREFNIIKNDTTEIVDNVETDKKIEKEVINSDKFQKYLDNLIKPLFHKESHTVDEVMEEAIYNHGTTDDYSTGAYMTTDGQLLNFNDHGYRDDHRTIDVFDLDMREFMDYGAIRMQPEGNGFQIAVEPTSAQYDRLEDYIDNYLKKNDDKIYVDCADSGQTYNSNTPTSKIINDIKTYFRTGTYPAQSDLAQFRYSLTTNKDSEGNTLSEGQLKYFKDSKAVDDDGNLLRLYHGGEQNYNVFRSEFNEYYFTPDENAAQDYGSLVRPFYLNFTNPYEVDFEGRNDKANDLYENGVFDVIDYAKENGYDGAIIRNTYDGANTHDQYVAFAPNQIKNVDNLNPTENDDIRLSLTSNENIDSKEVAPIGTTTDEMIAPIREDISNLSNQLNNLSNQIQTLQNGAEMTSDNEIAPVNPYRARAIAQREANQRAEEMYKDENYWKSLEEIVNQVSDLDEKSARKMSRNIGKELGLKQKQIKDLQNVIQKAFDEGYSLQDIRNELDMQFGHDTVMEKNYEVIDAQKMIRDFKIKVSPEIQKDIADYGYWKQKYFGKINFNSTGDTVDSVYQQLNGLNPAMFPDDIINPTDQLLRIAEVADMSKKYSVDYEMNPETIDEAANYINDTIQETLLSNAMKSQSDLEKNAMQYNERTQDIPIKKRTRAEVRENLQNTMGITVDDLQQGNDISSMSYNLTTPERVNEKVFGREVGRKINEQTVFFAKHQEAERIRFLNRELKEIADLGIKARSKESALVQQYGEGLLDDVQLAQAVSNKATQEKIKNAARVLRSKYDTYLDQINEELVDMGYDPIPKRKDYMRHFQELTDKFSQAGIPFNRQALNSENLPTDINGLTEFNVPGKNWFASAQRRTGEKTTYDAITGIDGYLQGASNLMYHTETIQRYRALENLIRNTYGQQHGLDVFGDDLTSEQAMQRIADIQEGKLSNYAAWLKEQGNAIAGKKGALDRGVERFFGRRAYTVANELKKQTGSNMTGFNVRSALTNFISSTIAASKTNKLAMVKGTVDTIRNMFNDDGFIDRSDFLTSRLRNDTSISKKAWQKISNAGQILMSGSDWFTSNVITRSKYYEGIQKGMTDAQAMNYANDFAARVMGDRSKGATAEAFNSKTLGFLTQFQLETNNQWQYMIHDTKMEYQENLAKEGGLKAGATVLFQVGQLAAYSYLFNEMFEQLTGSRAAFDILDIIKKLFGLDDDDKDKTFEERMQEAASELVDALPFASLFGSGGRLPIGEMLTPFQTFYDVVVGNTNKYGQKTTWKDFGKDVKETIPYYVLPTGYGQIKKTAQGLGMYANEVPGSYTDSGNLRFTADTDTGSVIKNALFGQWSGEEAKKYRESGYKTIRANDVQEMQDLNMNSSEYREYKNDLKEAGTKNADKLDYINSLNIPISQKNIMASNVVDRPVDMSDYTTYEEFDFAYKNPGKYQTMKAIANDYQSYQTYITGIEDVRDKYSQNKGYSTEQRKAKVVSYVNSLNLTIPQKAMLMRIYYPSYKRYNKEIVNYVSNLNIEYQEKVEILQSLKMKVDSNGNVSW